jgi:hypothetical protein
MGTTLAATTFAPVVAIANEQVRKNKNENEVKERKERKERRQREKEEKRTNGRVVCCGGYKLRGVVAREG